MYQALDSHYGDVAALIASAMPPLLWSVYELAKTRRLDAISVVVVASILFTLAATALGGSPKLIQIRDALVTGAVGMLFLLSLLMRRPVIFFLARAMMARNTEQGSANFERLWNKPGMPRLFFQLTAVWGLGLVLQTAVMCWLAWTWPISRYLLLGPVIGYGIFGVLMAWSLWYMARKGTAGRALFFQRT